MNMTYSILRVFRAMRSGIGKSGDLFDNQFRLLLILKLLAVAALCSGCALSEIRSQSQLIGSTGVIRGTVKRATDQTGPIVVSQFKKNEGVFILQNTSLVTFRKAYQFTVAPGTYYIAAFIDKNNDGAHQPGENWSFVNISSGIAVGIGQTVTVPPLIITADPPGLPNVVKNENELHSATRNIGQVVTLDDSMFNQDNYSLGMWRPVDFITQVGGGLFFLQNYDKNKIPVIFVHGANGGPTDMVTLMESLDKNRFQPWILYYPTGLRLAMVSEYLVKAVAETQNRYGYAKFVIIGHSMGGVITRSFVKKYLNQYPDRYSNLAMVMTINSPMEGVPSAAKGVTAPFMVQSWRDIAPDSNFLEELNTWSFPPIIPYIVVFSFENGNDGDGVVPLVSQIPLKLQKEATRMYGFNNDHVGTLNDPRFLELFKNISSNLMELAR